MAPGLIWSTDSRKYVLRPFQTQHKPKAQQRNADALELERQMGKSPSRLIRTGSWMGRQLSTCIVAETPPLAGGSWKNGLYSRLSALGAKGGSVTETLNEYSSGGGFVAKDGLLGCAKQLRNHGRIHDSLEIMEWMKERKMKFSHPERAVYLDLIARIKGVPAAENYFRSLSPYAQDRSTYGALLNCYCTELISDKAHTLFQKMDEMKFLSNCLPFNTLMSMYLKLGQPENVPAVVQAMKKRGICLSSFSYGTWMQSYGCLNDVEGVERILDEMETECEEKFPWTVYTHLATIYIKAGLFEKAESALKKLEMQHGLHWRHGREPFHFVISLYAGTQNLGEVNRLWNALKSSFLTTTNSSYLVMLQALAKLKDIEGVIKCFKEWESSYDSYDLRLANVAIRAYLEQDMYKGAASIFADALKRSEEVFFKAHEMFMVFFLKNHQLDLALKHMEAAFSEVKEYILKPDQKIVDTFFNYFEEEKDVDGAEKLWKILKKINCLDSNAYNLLLKTYIAAGRLAPEMRQRFKEADIEIDPEIENLLGRVCPQVVLV